jgi:hypothetical protein
LSQIRRREERCSRSRVVPARGPANNVSLQLSWIARRRDYCRVFGSCEQSDPVELVRNF